MDERMSGAHIDIDSVEAVYHVLGSVTAPLGADVDVVARGRVVCERLVAHLADYAVIDTLDAAGTWRRTAACHRDAGDERLLAVIPPPRRDSLLWSVLISGRSALVPRFSAEEIAAAAHSDDDRERRTQLGTKSGIAVALVADDRTFGTLVVGTTHHSGRDFAERHLKLMELVAAWCAAELTVAMAHAEIGDLRVDARRLLETERRLRARERASHDRQSRFLGLARSLSRATTAHEVADAFSEHGLGAADASNGGVYLIDSDRTTMSLAVAHGERRFVDAWSTIPLDIDAPVGFAATTGVAQFQATAGEIDAAYPHLAQMRAEMSDHAWATLPLNGAERCIGVLTFSFASERRFDATERGLLESIAASVAEALERGALFDREHDIAQRLQASLLPTVEPAYFGVRVAAAYRAAEADVAVGGDWFDVVTLPDERIAVVVGDVVGRGLTAAVTMGQLRTAFSVAAQSSDDLPWILSQLDLFADRVSAARCATLCCVVIDPHRRQMEVISAGHPPVIVIDALGARFVCEGRGTPIGAISAPQRQSVTMRAEPGTRVLLYTDGLVERRGVDLFESLATLRNTSVGAPAHNEPTWLIDRMTGNRPVDDDIAVVVAHMP
jgi:GAF domain-containing protein